MKTIPRQRKAGDGTLKPILSEKSKIGLKPKPRTVKGEEGTKRGGGEMRFASGGSIVLASKAGVKTRVLLRDRKVR